jgi:hypothetical protein
VDDPELLGQTRERRQMQGADPRAGADDPDTSRHLALL